MFAAFSQMITASAGAAPVISGTAYPGGTLTSTQAGQWFVNSSPVSGQTGSSYVVGLNDIGYSINQTGSNVLTCWSPADISAVHSFWTPYRNVYASTGPNVAATDGQTVVAWADIKSGSTLASATGFVWDEVGGSSYPVLAKAVATTRMSATSGAILSALDTVSHGYVMGGMEITGGNTNKYPLYLTTGASQLNRRLGLIVSAGNMAAASRRLDASTESIAAGGAYTTGRVFTSYSNFTLHRAYLRTDGADSATGSQYSGGTSGGASLAFAVGGRPDNTADYGVTGNYSCICVANTLLSASDQSKLERYMGLFWGLDIPLV